MRLMTVTAKQERDWQDWVASRPSIVRAMAEKFDPWTLYKLRPTGQLVTIYSFSENGTMTVDIPRKLNPMLVENRRVFGIDPNDLEETDLPREK